jgi:tetratricopeptide (TPR) repeat protein
MGFWKALFGGEELSPEEEKQQKAQKHFELLKYDGVKAMKTGRADYALRCFEEALKLKDDLEVHDYLSQVHTRLGDTRSALTHLEALAAAQPDNAAVRLRMAQVAYMDGNYTQAEEQCRQAMTIDETSPLPYLLAAQARLAKGDFARALKLLDQAVGIDDNFAEARLLRSQILLRTGKTKAAQADAEWLHENVGDHEDILLLQARIAAAQHRHADAVELYNMVIDQNPFSLEGYTERGKQRLALGDKAGAEEDLKAAKELSQERT